MNAAFRLGARPDGRAVAWGALGAQITGLVLISFLVAALTGALGNGLLTSSGSWHVADWREAASSAWLAGFGGTWHLQVTAGLPLGVTVRVLTGSAALPWNTMTAEILVIAALAARFFVKARPLPVVATTFIVNLVAVYIVGAAVSAGHGVKLSTRALELGNGVKVGLSQVITASPNASAEWALTSLVIATAAGVGVASRSEPSGKSPAFFRVVGPAVYGLAVAAAAAFVVATIAVQFDRGIRGVTYFGQVLALGAPAVAAQSLAIGVGAPMTVRATVLGAGVSHRAGLLQGGPTVWFSAVMLLIALSGAALAGRRFVERSAPRHRAQAAVVSVPFAFTLWLWVSSSGLTVRGQLASTSMAVLQVLGKGLLGMVPAGGSLLSGMLGSLLGSANQSGLVVRWGASPGWVLLGALVVGALGAWLGALSAPARAVGRALPPTPVIEEVPGRLITNERLSYEHSRRD